MSTKPAIPLLFDAAAVGVSSCFAYGTSNDNGAWSAGNGSAVAMNPDGDTVAHPAFQSIESGGQVSIGIAQNHIVPTAVANCADGPVVVEHPGFRSEQSRAAVRQVAARDHALLPAVATNPNGG